MKKLIIIQTATPDYRAGVFQTIRDRLGVDFELYRGSHYFETSVRTDERITAKNVKNRFLFGRRALFQSGVLHLMFSKAVLVMEMNPRIITNWILLMTRKIQGKKTVLWGHAWPRSGQGSKSDSLRQEMRKMASTIIVYTKQQQKELKTYMPAKNILAAPNALLSAQKMSGDATEGIPEHLIYVGRLTEAKKPLFLAQSFAKMLKELPVTSKLIIVGDGEELPKLQKFVIENTLEDRIIIKGHLNEYSVLRDLYRNSLCSVSPGYVGLSITQSFGFGVPMLISKDEPHSPELEAAIVGKNAVFYESDNFNSFRESVLKIYRDKQIWLEKRPEISNFCKENYSVEAMAEVFVNLAQDYGA